MSDHATKESETRDGFYAGYAAALSVALSGEDGSTTRYVEAMECINVRAFLAWAAKNDDIELPRIKEAMRFIRERKAIRRRMHAPAPVPTPDGAA